MVSSCGFIFKKHRCSVLFIYFLVFLWNFGLKKEFQSDEFLTAACLIFQPSLPYNVFALLKNLMGLILLKTLVKNQKRTWLILWKLCQKRLCTLKLISCFYKILDRQLRATFTYRNKNMKFKFENHRFITDIFNMHVFLTDYCFRQAKL